MRHVLPLAHLRLGGRSYDSVVNEEHSGNGTLACVARGYRADAAICADGGSIIRTESGGGVYWEITVMGREIHTGARWRGGELFGVSAIEKAALIVNALCETERRVNKDKTCLSLGAGVINGGSYMTSTAGRCTVKGVAYFSAAMGTGAAGIERVMDLLKAVIDEVSEKDEWLCEHRPEIIFPHYDDAYVYPEGHELLPLMLNAGKDILGKEPATGAMSACDARHLGNGGGIPCLICGPDGGMAHAPNEFVSIEGYLDFIKFLALSVYRWCE